LSQVCIQIKALLFTESKIKQPKIVHINQTREENVACLKKIGIAAEIINAVLYVTFSSRNKPVSLISLLNLAPILEWEHQ
jgi:hypothetical protein